MKYLLVLLFFVVALATPVYAQTKGAFLDKELEHFKDKGAKGYLIWQYSGDHGNPLGDTDKYSLYSDDLGDPGDAGSICGVMKKWSGQYEFLGFNVYSLGMGRGGPLSAGQIAGVLTPLKNCGTNVVRVFIGRSCGNDPAAVPECVGRMAAGAGSAGVRLILTVGDAVSGGGGIPSLTGDNLASWFGGGYLSSQYPAFLQQTAAAAAGNGNIYGIEIANEPHCGPINAAGSYNQWAGYSIGIVKRGSGNVGIGQATIDPNDACDGANTNLLPGNKAAGATMVSSHYYTDDQRSAADAAAGKVVPAGLKFYIGEAALLGIKKFPPTGPFLDNSPGIEPKTGKDIKNVDDVTIGSTAQQSGEGFRPSDFTGFTQTNFQTEDGILSYAFDINNGGGAMTPNSFNPIYPTDQIDYTGDKKAKEVVAAGKFNLQFEGDPKESTCYESDKAAQSESPDAYVRTIASYENLRSVRIPTNLIAGDPFSSNNKMQWRFQQPDIATKAPGSDELTLTNDYWKSQLQPCDSSVNAKQVPSIATPIEGFWQTVAQAWSDIVSSFWLLVSRQVCTTDDKGNKSCYNVDQAKLDVKKVATIFLPGSPRMETTALGVTGDKKQQGSLLTFFPANLINRLSQNVGYTNKSGGGNVLGASTDSNAPDSIPHYQMHEVKYAFKCISSNMLIPASIQQIRDTKCKLEGAGTTPTPTPTPPNALANPAGWMGSVKLPPGFTTWAALTDDQIRYLEQQIANLAACHGAGVPMDSSKCPAGEPKNVAWTNSQLGNASQMNDVIQKAQSSGLNPVFVMALGIEETHMGDAGNRVFGCGPSGAYTGVQDSFTCLATKTVDPVTGQSYLTNQSLSATQSLCIYAYGDRSGNCFNNPSVNYPSAISTYINLLNPPSTTTPTP